MRPMKSNMKKHYAVPNVLVRCFLVKIKIFSVMVTFVNNILFPTTFTIENNYLTVR